MAPGAWCLWLWFHGVRGDPRTPWLALCPVRLDMCFAVPRTGGCDAVDADSVSEDKLAAEWAARDAVGIWDHSFRHGGELLCEFRTDSLQRDGFSGSFGDYVVVNVGLLPSP